MPNQTETQQTLQRLFRSRPVALLQDLYDAFGTHSRMTVFRRLREVGYSTSFTHSGRYYTLSGVPSFDQRGLWFVEEIGFSRFGTLKETVAVLVSDASAGITHAELETLLRVRSLNPLRDLVEEGRVGRQRRGRTHLYVSPDGARAQAQLDRREEGVRGGEEEASLPKAVVLEVLVEAARVGRVAIDAVTLAARLELRGVRVTAEQVRRICEHYGIRQEKKTAE